jgi:predicted DNA-binding transcriptional regulator YafY
MAKRDSLFKIFQIISCLKRSPATYEEIIDYIESHNYNNLELSLSKRTLERDFEDIRNIFNYEIVFDRSIKKYRLKEDEGSENYYAALYESIELMSAFQTRKQFEPYIYLENRNFAGIAYIQKILQSIISRNYIQFDYKKFYDEEFDYTTRIVQPVALKQFKLRWYLLAKENDKLKVFGLDRMSNLITLKRTFKKHNDNIQQLFKNCYGIIIPENYDEPPPEIVLEFNDYQIKYYETLPLHPSQTIEYKGNNIAHLKVKVYPTYDFISEILSNIDCYKVISPPSFKETIKEYLQNALEKHY